MRLLVAEGPSLEDHHAAHGPLRLPPRRDLLDAVDDSGLLGRGGAGFPTGRKLRTVAAGTRPVVLGNGCEGEPTSSKDTLLLTAHPHLVLDGLQVAAHAVGATQAHLAVTGRGGAMVAVHRAAAERHDRVPVTLHRPPARYVASEETALVNLVNTGRALPTFTPPRPFEAGIGRRPTLVSNVETLAHLALIARHGPQWFRSAGDPDEPGTMLVTVSGHRGRAVHEVETGTPLRELLPRGRGSSAQAVLVGGYFGTWLAAESARGLRLTHSELHAAGGALGAGIVVVLPPEACGLTETARVLGYLAQQSAGQCGPCVHGLPAIARAMAALAVGPWDDRTMTDLDRWLGVVAGRGACRHPDGAVRFAVSALTVFAHDLAEHRAGRPCAGRLRPPLLPTGEPR